jgi:hypothetical protein
MLRNPAAFVLIGVCLMVILGCGKSERLIKAKGQIVKNGEDFIPEDDENLQVCFIPIADDLSPPRNWYAAEVDQSTGAFYASGGEKKGMPPGRYRVMVELKKKRKDVLGGKLDSLNSPWIFEVDEETPLMVVDLEQKPEK